MSFFKPLDVRDHRRTEDAAGGRYDAVGSGRSGNGDGRSIFHPRVGYRMNADRRGLPQRR
jgi:hypothetical protein